ncbi:hypothetical protein C4K15_3355 [Pseudomonas chlororaphis subsp. aurantiaca]|nr:hypothetical protein C4K15_3355 [Pseudomonas chlororaphis subsp. aurantiaca]
MPEAAWFAHVESPENARTAWDIVVRPLPDACLPLCARYLIATAIDPLSLIPLSTWKTVLAGFTTAARPIAGFASGYRGRGVCVAAAAGCDRPRSGRPPGAAVSQALRVGRFCVCFAAGRRLRQRLQGTQCFCSRCRRLRSAAKRSSSRRRGFSGIARRPVLRLLHSRAQASPAATKNAPARLRCSWQPVASFAAARIKTLAGVGLRVRSMRPTSEDCP